MTWRTVTSVGLVVGTVWGAPCAVAHADEAADTGAARILGGDGVLLADGGDCPAAIDKLTRAEALHHAPTTAGRLGECEIAVGRLVAGTERLQRVLREPLGAGASPASVAAVARARGVLETALPRIPTIRVSVLAPMSAHYTVTLDSETLPEAVLGSDRPADPRAHKVQVVAEGFVTVTRDVVLTEGEAMRLSLELVPDPHAPAPRTPLAAPRHMAQHGPSTNGVAAGIALAFGALGLGGGIAGGLVVAQQSADLSKACGSDKVCPSDKQSEISSSKTWATVSTVGFAVAGAGLGATVVILLAGNKSGHEPSASAQVGPTYVGLTGRF